MKKANFKKIFAVLVSFVLIAVIALTMQACTSNKSSEETTTLADSTSSLSDVTVDSEASVTLGEGETQFLFNVYHKDGGIKNYVINTDKTTVGEALVELDVIAGDDGDYGLYVKTVDGETLDYDTDQMYWAFYVGDEYAQAGVDKTDIENGATYAFKAEK